MLFFQEIYISSQSFRTINCFQISQFDNLIFLTNFISLFAFYNSYFTAFVLIMEVKKRGFSTVGDGKELWQRIRETNGGFTFNVFQLTTVRIPSKPKGCKE